MLPLIPRFWSTHLLILSPVHPSPTLIPPWAYPTASAPQLTRERVTGQRHLSCQLPRLVCCRYSHPPPLGAHPSFFKQSLMPAKGSPRQMLLVSTPRMRKLNFLSEPLLIFSPVQHVTCQRHALKPHIFRIPYRGTNGIRRGQTVLLLHALRSDWLKPWRPWPGE